MMSKIHEVSLLLKERINIFYFLAFAPLLIFAYYHSEWLFSIIIPIYGFILLLTKKQNLLLYHQAKTIQKALGLLMMFGSFFVYYALIPFLSTTTFYTTANYVIYLLGLCLTFFEASALREIATSIFLIVAATSSPFISEWLRPYFSSYIPQFVYFIGFVLESLGMKVRIENPNVIIIYPLGQPLPLQIVWECIGVTSLLIFSIILVIILFEEEEKLQTKLLWSIIGLLGTFILNFLRIIVIFLTDYYYGAEAGTNVHYTIGYALFITWLAFYLYMFSKRQVLSKKVHFIRQKLFGGV